MTLTVLLCTGQPAAAQQPAECGSGPPGGAFTAAAGAVKSIDPHAVDCDSLAHGMFSRDFPLPGLDPVAALKSCTQRLIFIPAQKLSHAG